MIKKLMKWLLKPYPFPDTIKGKLFISLSFGVFVSLFLFIFKPFYFDDLGEKQLFIALVYGTITFFTIFFNLVGLPFLFKKQFSVDLWCIYKEIIFIISTVLIVAVLISYASIIFLNHSNLFFFISNTFLTSILPVFIYVFFIEKTENTKNNNTIKKLSTVQIDESNTIEVLIKGDNKDEELIVPLSDILYMISEKNYVSVFYNFDGCIKETLLRSSLNNIERQLIKFNKIVRCHKSYIVNATKVEDVQGNARGFLLKIINIDALIPVSRSFPKEQLATLFNK